MLHSIQVASSRVYIRDAEFCYQLFCWPSKSSGWEEP